MFGLTADEWIAIFTLCLAVTALFQLLVFGLQAKRLRETVESAERASMPFLFPRVKSFNLHPAGMVEVEATHRSEVAVTFQNLGKTPAIIRRMGAKLLLVDRDQFPRIPPALEQIPGVGSDAVVAANSAGGTRTWSFERHIAAEEIRDLKRDTRGPYKRFYIIGFVVYDDFFDVRHTKRFCLKVRQNGFQAMRGGAAHNSVKRQQLSEADLGDPNRELAEE